MDANGNTNNSTNLKNVEFRAVWAEHPGESYTDDNGSLRMGLQSELDQVKSQLVGLGYTRLVDLKFAVTTGTNGRVIFTAVLIAEAPEQEGDR